MIVKFNFFINEGAEYHLFKGVPLNGMYSILEDGYIKWMGTWDSSIRKASGIKYGISATRNFKTAFQYGDFIIEFKTSKLKDDFDVIPFTENPDYYLYMKGGDNIFSDKKREKPFRPTLRNLNTKKWIKKATRSKNPEDWKEFWRVKTDPQHSDFGIAEEVIITKKIPLDYIKKVYVISYKLSSSTYFNEILEKLSEEGIDWDFVDKKHYAYQKYKDKLKKKIIN